MVMFIVRFGNRGSRISRLKSSSVVDAKRKFKKLHPNATIDSVTLSRKRR